MANTQPLSTSLVELDNGISVIKAASLQMILQLDQRALCS